MNSGTLWRIQSRFVGPFDSINAGSEQQAMYWGTDATHYLKAEIDWNPVGGQRRLAVWQQNGSGGSVLGSIALPGGNANTLDFRLDGDPTVDNGQVAVSYAVNGGAFVSLGTFTGLGALFTANNQAGVFASHQGGAQFVTKFESFSVQRR
jgi:hypothetical protein